MMATTTTSTVRLFRQRLSLMSILVVSAVASSCCFLLVDCHRSSGSGSGGDRRLDRALSVEDKRTFDEAMNGGSGNRNKKNGGPLSISTCFIKNAGYKYEFLHSYFVPGLPKSNKAYTNLISEENIESFTWVIQSADQIKFHSSSNSNSNSQVENGKNDGNNHTAFYLINVKQMACMCAEVKKFRIFNPRRPIALHKLSPATLERPECMWSLQHAEAEKPDRYHIWNKRYNEPLYAASSLFKTAKSQRNIYTWSSTPNSRQFIWSLICNA